MISHHLRGMVQCNTVKHCCTMIGWVKLQPGDFVMVPSGFVLRSRMGMIIACDRSHVIIDHSDKKQSNWCWNVLLLIDSRLEGHNLYDPSIELSWDLVL